jgi:hypothetical protein
MKRGRLPVRLIRAGLVLAACSLAPQTPAWGQGVDGWSFIITPQVWISHIAKNGFSSAPNSAAVGRNIFFDPNTGDIQSNLFPTTSSTPNEVVDPQWGIQFAAQKDRLTLAFAFQYVSFETRNELTYNGSLPLCDPFLGIQCVTSGNRWAQEFVSTTRMDMDLAASYAFPDVVKEWLDLGFGVGFKFIYASASREYANLNPVAASWAAVGGFLGGGQGLYTICTRDDCSDAGARDRVKQQSYLCAATFPMKATVHLTRDARWLLPFSLTPLIGAEVRDDHNVVYSLNLPPNVNQLSSSPPRVDRLDGATLAYGVTADATLRWLINDAVSAYAGMRVQYINGHEEFLAYGPLVGMSVRFGGR